MIYDSVYSISTENHGLVTSAAAKEVGAKDKDLARWVKIGRMIKIGHGVYRILQYPFSEDDVYANAVACAGPKAYLFGESVIGLLRLAPTNPKIIHIAVPVRSRRRLPASCKVHIQPSGYTPTIRDGIPIQKPVDAIRSCLGVMMPERLEAAANEAYRTGLLFKEDLQRLVNEIKRHA